MRVVRLLDEPDWQSRLSPIEKIFFATSPSSKTLRLDERQAVCWYVEKRGSATERDSDFIGEPPTPLPLISVFPRSALSMRFPNRPAQRPYLAISMP